MNEHHWIMLNAASKTFRTDAVKTHAWFPTCNSFPEELLLCNYLVDRVFGNS